QAEDGIRDLIVTGVQTCALPISPPTRSIAFAPAGATPAKKRSPRSPSRLPAGRRLYGSSRQSAAIASAPPFAKSPTIRQRPLFRSEERRVGKECTLRWSTHHARK